MYLFSYGSLINRTSAENVLKRELDQKDLIPAVIKGYRRCWRAREDLYFNSLGRNATGIFLDLRDSTGMQVNGVLIKISANELARLKLREKNYKCIDVSAKLQDPMLKETVYTFICRPEHILRHEKKEVFIPQRYIDMVRSGCLAIGPDFLTLYETTTEPSSLPVVEGAYRFLDPTQAQYV